MEDFLPDFHSGLNRRVLGRPLANRIAALCKDCAPAGSRITGGSARRSLSDVNQQHITVQAGRDIVTEGERSRGVYTMCDGWAVRYQRLGTGVRQILDVLLPGDTIALASAIFGTNNHSVEAITSANLCMLNGRQIVSLLKTDPGFAFGVLRDRVADERRADARATMLGRMRAEEKLGYFMVEIYDRLQRRGLTDGMSCPFPLRRNEMADAVGLSKVHISRALRELRSQALLDIKGHDMIIPDVARLANHTGYVLT